jgi:hypothetical protein
MDAVKVEKIMRTFTALASLMLLSLAQTVRAGIFPDFGYAPPAGWTGQRFELSQDYPTQLPHTEAVPWASIDFTSQPKEYMAAVLQYAFEGNLEKDFVVQANAVRKWFHAPWLHWGNNGREFVRGLTRERTSRRFELAATQDQPYRNYAVGFYNPRGGYVIGKVWRDPHNPNTANVSFSEGSVASKLLFTTAPVSQVPYLHGAPEWVADIHRSQDPQEIEQTRVRLLQIDLAVRDSRSLNAAWVFGTLQYDASVQAESPWLRLRPVALMWGNDPTLKESDYNNGQRPNETWINPDAPIVKYRSNLPAGGNPPHTLGWAGRGNGPVDHPASSCLSCHATAQIPATSSMAPPNSLPEAEKLRWFRNLRVGEPFDADSQSLDFSLQLRVGIQNFQRLFEKSSRGGIRSVPCRDDCLFISYGPH